MIPFLKGIFYDQSNRVTRMLLDLQNPRISKEIDLQFLQKTNQLLEELRADIELLIHSGDLDIEALANYHVIRYNTFHERLLMIELFRYLVITNYGEAEAYFKKKISRIYNEIACLQKQPIITTISNSENYYWALPTYDIIAVPGGEEKTLLNLPDLYHEMGHLIYNQSQFYLNGDTETAVARFYQDEIQRVVDEQRDSKLISFYRDKKARWLNGWIMEFTCDFIATYLVGPAYAWTNLKITTLSSGKDRVYADSPSHPSDEARMRAIFFMLRQLGYTTEVLPMEADWQSFLKTTRNPIPANYQFVFPHGLIETLGKNVYQGCESVGLRSYPEQLSKFKTPISKILNDAWLELFTNPANYKVWEEEKIKEIAGDLTGK